MILCANQKKKLFSTGKSAQDVLFCLFVQKNHSRDQFQISAKLCDNANRLLWHKLPNKFHKILFMN